MLLATHDHSQRRNQLLSLFLPYQILKIQEIGLKRLMGCKKHLTKKMLKLLAKLQNMKDPSAG